MSRKQTGRVAVLISISLLMVSSVKVWAVTYTSPGYSVTEVQFGSGSGDATSTSYKSSAGLGTNGVGNSSSANYRSTAGFITPNQPYLELQVTAATIDLGVLSPSVTATGTANFMVRTYLSGSYAVYTMSPPPTSEGGAVLAPISVAANSVAGTEQFGINLVANTSPATFGSNPANIPDNSYADGHAAPGYNTTNQYKYNQGDVIAGSPTTAGKQATGETDYTISYIANIAPLTKAGLYTMVHDIVAVATY